jgi:hypothetical protein
VPRDLVLGANWSPVQVRCLEEECVQTNMDSRAAKEASHLDLEDSKATHAGQPLEIVL